MKGVLALRHLCPLVAPTFLLLGVLLGAGPRIQKREEDMSGWRLPQGDIRHGVRLATLHPPFFNGG